MPDRDVEWSLKANDRASAATNAAAAATERLADKTDKAARKTDELGDQTGQLTRKLMEARAAALGAARAFDQSGDPKILKDFQKINSEAQRLSRVLKALRPEDDSDRKVQSPNGILGKLVSFGRQAGLIAGDAAVDGIGTAFKALPAPVKTALIGALALGAAGAAPVIAGAIGGAVIAGIGAAGIGAGLVFAAKDPRVIAEYQGLGQRIGQKLQDGAVKPFVGELLAASPKLEQLFASQEPRLRRIGATLASVVGPVLNDVSRAVDNIMPSIERGAKVAVPIIRQIFSYVPGIAKAIGNLFDAFSAGGPGAAAALGILLGQLQAFINLLAFGARMSAPFLNFFGQLVTLGGLAHQSGGQVSQLSTIVKDSGLGAQAAGYSYESLSSSLQNTANAARQLNENFDRLFQEQMSVDQANLQVKQSQLQLTESIKENGRTLDANTAKGQANIQAILGSVQALNAKREADIAAGNGTVEASQRANAAYLAQLGGLRQLLYSLGLNKAQVDALIGAYERLAQPQTKVFTTVYRTQGTPPGYSDEKTGHSRTGANDYAGVSGWAPHLASFAARDRAAFAAGTGGGSMPRTPPVEVHSESNVTVELDGSPFRAMTIRTTRVAEARQAWRNKVGKR
jgi:hypothetical protein